MDRARGARRGWCRWRRGLPAGLLLIWLAACAVPPPRGSELSPPTSALADHTRTVLLTSYGATCDGRHNDQPALQAAVEDVSSRGGGVVVVPPTTCRVVQTAAVPFTTLTGSVIIRGTSTSMSTLSVDSDDADGYRELFRITGGRVSLQSVSLVRSGDVYGVMIDIVASKKVSIDNVVINGRKDSYRAREFHGIVFGGDSGDVRRDFSMSGTTVEEVDFGLFQADSTPSRTDGFSVTRSVFIHNYADDLELNAPQGSFTDVTVSDSQFLSSSNESDYGAGFGIGMANVQHVTIERNTFDGRQYEPIHMENKTAFVIVRDNIFKNSFTAPLSWASHVFIIGSSHNIEITGNMFDTTANANQVDCVYVGDGGTQAAPDQVLISGNTFMLRPTATVVAVYGATRVSTSSNRTVPVA